MVVWACLLLCVCVCSHDLCSFLFVCQIAAVVNEELSGSLRKLLEAEKSKRAAAATRRHDLEVLVCVHEWLLFVRVWGCVTVALCAFS